MWIYNIFRDEEKSKHKESILTLQKDKGGYAKEHRTFSKEPNDAKEIKNYLLKKYEQVYFIDDIEKCLLKINK